MARNQVNLHLSDAEYAALRGLSQLIGRSAASIARQAVTEFLASPAPKRLRDAAEAEARARLEALEAGPSTGISEETLAALEARPEPGRILDGDDSSLDRYIPRRHRGRREDEMRQEGLEEGEGE